MVKVLLKYKYDNDIHTNVYRAVNVDNSSSKDCPKLLAINSFELDWYEGKTILEVKIV
jgi:hypothetical protein